jgi:dihydrofolate reductase
MKTVGAMLMGRKSFDVVNAMGPEMWAYGDIPFFVATSRALDPPRPSVRAVKGDITASVAAARSAADGRVVYVDGGSLIRSSLDAGLIDEIIVTLVPKVLGTGIPLFAGVSKRHELEVTVFSHAHLHRLFKLLLRTSERCKS